MHKNYTITPAVKKMPEYEKIVAMLERLSSSDVVKRLHGNCISAADIIQNMLSFYGVESTIMECQAFVVKENKEIKDFCFVGFNNIGINPNSVDTHVIVITKTDPPVLIDGSLGYLLPPNEEIFIREVNSLDPDLIGQYQMDDITVTYHPKKNIKLPSLHQKNLMERLGEDKKIAEKLKFLQIIVIVAASMSLINFSLNITLLILKMMFP